MLGIFTHVMAYHVPAVSVTVCNLAVLGTEYIRDEPLEEFIEIEAGSSTTLTVPHVHAADTIGNVLAINLRQSIDSELSFVQLTNGAIDTEVLIDATDLAVGNYTLKLESFDKNGGVFSSLKIDTVNIVVVAFTAIELPVQTIISGEKTDWTLPQASSS